MHAHEDVGMAPGKVNTIQACEIKMKLCEQHLNQPDPKKSGRRDFLLGLGRIAFLGGVILSGYVIKKQKNGGPEPERCPNGSMCRNCAIFSDCNLPAALAARRDAERK